MQYNPYLSGNYTPVNDELAVQHLKIIGEIPNDLTVIYMRNGPNPAFMPICIGLISSASGPAIIAHFGPRLIENINSFGPTLSDSINFSAKIN